MADAELKQKVLDLIQTNKGPKGLLEEEIAETLDVSIIFVKDALYELSHECPHCNGKLEDGARCCPHCQKEVHSGKVGFVKEKN